MKRITLIVLAAFMALAPLGAQGRKAVKQAKEDSKYLVSQLKEEGYKPLDNNKLDDAVKDYLAVKYSEKNLLEVVGKATSKSLNEAKSQAREDAMSYYPYGEVASSFFVYRKVRKRYNVSCYALLRTGSRGSSFTRSSQGTASAIASARAEQAAKESQAEAKKLEKQARQEAVKAQKKAEKEADKARAKADKAHQKAVDKANEKARKAIEKADREREKALEGIGNY
ncbi:MAG: hypothetical protein IJ205_09605 [Bacteroidales bacterium]|nr:hypothetical protein [Bacteroidales bacterium]